MKPWLKIQYFDELKRNEPLTAPTRALSSVEGCQLTVAEGTKTREVLFHHNADITPITYFKNILIPLHVLLYFKSFPILAITNNSLMNNFALTTLFTCSLTFRYTYLDVVLLSQFSNFQDS